MSKAQGDKVLPSMTEEQFDLPSHNSFNSFLSEESRTGDSFNGFDHQDAHHIKTADTTDMMNHELEFDSVQKRLETFTRWPDDSPVKPWDLAKAGFYSTGVDDRVVCFKCDLRLRQWKTGDDPWKEHKLFSSHCSFLLECENERDSHVTLNAVETSNLQNSAHVSAKRNYSRFDEVIYPEERRGNNGVDDVIDTGLPPYCDPEGVHYRNRPQPFSQGGSDLVYHEQPFYRNPDYPAQTGFHDQHAYYPERIPQLPGQDRQRMHFQRPEDQRPGQEVTKHHVVVGPGSSQVRIVGSVASIYYIKPEDELYIQSGGQASPQQVRPGRKLTPVNQSSRIPLKVERSLAGSRESGRYTPQEQMSGRYEPYSALSTEQTVKKPGYGEKWSSEVQGSIEGGLVPHESQEESGRYVVQQHQNNHHAGDTVKYSTNSFQQTSMLSQTPFPEKVPQEQIAYEPAHSVERKVSDENGPLQENYYRTQQYPAPFTGESSPCQAYREVKRRQEPLSHSGQARQALPIKDPSLQPAQRLIRHEDARHVTSSSDLENQHHRLTTFVDWPHDHPIHPYELSAAGFYYLGKSDSVRCFKCSISLHNWDPDDTPWGEHKKWSPRCPLVLQHFSGRPQQNEEHVTRQERYPYPQETPYYRRQEQSRFSSDRRVPIVGGGRPVHGGLSRPQHFPAQAVSNVGRPRDPPLEQQRTQWQTEPVTTPQEAGHVTSGRQAGSTGESSSNPNQRSCSPRGSTSLELDGERLSEMGFSQQQIDDAISARVEATGSNFASYADLVSALLESRGRQLGNSASPQPTEQGCRSASPPPPIIIRSDISTSLLQENQNLPERNCMSAVTSPTTPFADIISLRRSFSEPAQSFLDSGEESLEEKLERMQEERMCKICMDAEVSVVFLPCGHLSCCAGCANGMNLCPMCRRPIQEKVRTYLS